MSKDIKIKKGLDVKLVGEADTLIKDAPLSNLYGITLADFHKVIPKMVVKEGDKVNSGTTIFFSKKNPQITFASPVSGTIKEIVRGAKRKITQILIEADKKISYETHTPLDVNQSSPEEIKAYFTQTGAWAFIKKRPYDVLANPEDTPKAIFISAYDSAPLSPDYDFSLRNRNKELQAGINVLKQLTNANIHITLDGKSMVSPFSNLKNIERHHAFGKHPVGTVSVQMAQISPLNKGETVWTLTPDNLAILGHLVLTGEYKAEKVIALAGGQVKHPHYLRVLIGAPIQDLTKDNIEGDNNRYISGNPLTGRNAGLNGFFGFYDNTLSVIPEGNDYQFFGWQLPQMNKFSVLRANMFSWLTPNKRYNLNTNTNGEHRAFVLTGHFEKVFPLDIHPQEFLKACIVQDIDQLEALGIYEVAPEDFALTEFIDVSKNNHQEIVRKALDLMIDEVG